MKKNEFEKLLTDKGISINNGTISVDDAAKAVNLVLDAVVRSVKSVDEDSFDTSATFKAHDIERLVSYKKIV